MPGDNIYKTFPNLYAVRGTPPRSCEDWYRSLDKVRHLKPHHLVPSHTEPISGEDNVYDIITHYRDAIQFINDQTIRHLNNGFTIDEIVQRVRLPQSLALHSYLQEHYGTVVWSVRSVINGKIGWYDRDPVNLFPLTKLDEAKKLKKLLSNDFNESASGREKILVTAEEIAKNPTATDDEIQWSLKLSMHACRLAEPGSQFHNRAVAVASNCLNKKAAAVWNPSARNTFILAQKLLNSKVSKNTFAHVVTARIEKWPISFVMEKLRYQFKAEACNELEVMTLIFAFPDVNQQHSYTMRHCIVEYHNIPDLIPKKYDAKITCNSLVWKRVLTNTEDIHSVNKNGRMVVEGDFDKFLSFIKMLDVGKDLLVSSE